MYNINTMQSPADLHRNFASIQDMLVRSSAESQQNTRVSGSNMSVLNSVITLAKSSASNDVFVTNLRAALSNLPLIH
jgi:hypothetical protein